MNKHTKIILGLVGLGIVGLVVYNMRKGKIAASAGAAMPDNNAANAAGEGLWVIGAYDAPHNRTWIFPSGNMGLGRFVTGYAGPQGTTFRPVRGISAI
jgi:hypothetical protein